MLVHEIPRNEWVSFMKAFGRQHEGWFATVERSDPLGRLVTLENRRLRQTQAETSSRGARIAFIFGDDKTGPDTQIADMPEHVRFLETDEHAHVGLEIELAGGRRLSLRFDSPMPPEMLDGVLPEQAGQISEAQGGRMNKAKERSVKIPVKKVVLHGDLVIPNEPRGLVLFAHGSGSSRRSPRNRYVAAVLQQANIATLLFDLLTDVEERVDESTAELRFDIGLLASRLGTATDWVLGLDDFDPTGRLSADELRLGYFGASTGAAAALIAASRRDIAAIVSRGGRPDLAGDALRLVTAPTLLIVGGNDDVVIGMNQEAQSQMKAETRLEIIPGATHLFEEPGALEEVARLARMWFEEHLGHRRESDYAA